MFGFKHAKKWLGEPEVITYCDYPVVDPSLGVGTVSSVVAESNKPNTRPVFLGIIGSPPDGAAANQFLVYVRRDVERLQPLTVLGLYPTMAEARAAMIADIEESEIVHRIHHAHRLRHPSSQEWL